MGAAVPKQYLALAGRPILAHALAAFEAVEEIGRIALVLPAEDVREAGRRILLDDAPRIPVTVVAGGAERQASVQNGIRALADIEILASVNYGEDSMGKGIPLPKALDFLR